MSDKNLPCAFCVFSGTNQPSVTTIGVVVKSCTGEPYELFRCENCGSVSAWNTEVAEGMEDMEDEENE
jgi:hypothetical protein